MGFRHEVDPLPKPALASLHTSIVDETSKQRFTIAFIEVTQRELLVDVVLPLDTQCLRYVRPCEISNPRAQRQPSCGSASFFVRWRYILRYTAGSPTSGAECCRFSEPGASSSNSQNRRVLERHIKTGDCACLTAHFGQSVHSVFGSAAKRKRDLADSQKLQCIATDK